MHLRPRVSTYRVIGCGTWHFLLSFKVRNGIIHEGETGIIQYSKIARINNPAKEARNAVVCGWGDERRACTNPAFGYIKKHRNCSKTPRVCNLTSASKCVRAATHRDGLHLQCRDLEPQQAASVQGEIRIHAR
jgi:hypothetical protein